MRVYTIVLNHRHVEDTIRCLASLASSSHLDQIPVVVDNGSGADAVEQLRAGLDGVRVLSLPENTGYGAGNNVGIRYALDHGAEAVWVLNPDTIVEPHTLGTLVAALDSDPSIGIVGPRIVNGGSRPLTIWFNGGEVDLVSGGATRHLDSGVPDAQVPHTGLRDVDYVTGAAMLVRRRLLETVGLIPEEYFLYFEETDLCLRARRAGWRVVVEQEARLAHYKRSAGRLPTPYYVYYYVRNRFVFGQRFTSLPPSEIERSVQDWIAAWRKRVERADPGWVGVYDRLVESALEDGRRGVLGRRDDLHTTMNEGSEK